jgi:GntR family transcriptional regulator/MocR family aminotransferase
MDLHVSLIGRKDLSGEIYRQLRRSILDGRLRPGDVLPPTRELARGLGVSRTTATLAYDRLAGEGFVTARIGAGTFVSDVPTLKSGPGEPLRLRRSASPGPRFSVGLAKLRPRRVWDAIALPTAFDRPAQFDFRTGLPDASLFPHTTWRRLLARQLREDEAVAGGVYAHPAGHRGLREAIARHIGIARAVIASADDVTITSGTQQALDVVARVLLAPGDRVVVEDPGYPPPRRLFMSLGAEVHSGPVDRAGLIVEPLPRNTRLVYVTPSHQYPTGVVMTLERRLALLAWAERNNAAIIEDDYDSEFRFGGRPIEPLQTLDRAGRVIYVGSFSKTLLPTLRLGFVVTSPSVRDAVHKAKHVTDWHTSLLVQAALARFMEEGGFARHIRRMGAVYRERHALITSTLVRDFADHLEVIPSAAGLHVAAVAPGLSAGQVAAVARRAAEAGVEVQELAKFTVGQWPAGLMIGYGAIATGEIREGLRRLRESFLPL